MKLKLLLVLLILPLFLIINCLPYAKYNVYQNEEIGFKVKYPAGWKIEQTNHKTEYPNAFRINFNGPRLISRGDSKYCDINAYTSEMEISVSDYFGFQGMKEGVSNTEIVKQYMSGYFDSFTIKDDITVLVRKGAFGASPACFLGEYTAMFYVDAKGFVEIQLAWDYEDYEKAKEIFQSFEFID
jgi:hypothetical protein